ncbi:MAG: AAA family ATPase [Phycisphaeraceae bacterium]|nr:AAA family ATPase [Phycisphaeraceae bacterium]
MSPPPNLVLIGLRGSGKSTLGRALAERRRAEFIDLDDLIALDSGFESAGAALRSLGEPAFRAVERRVFERLLASSASGAAEPAQRVIALGGGTPTAHGAESLLESAKARGAIRIVLLHADTGTLCDRIARSGVLRPSLTALTPREEMDALAAARLGLYRRLAEGEIDTTLLDAHASLDALDAAWK